MRTIEVQILENVVHPSEPLPQDAKLIVFNGTAYVIYEEGDELPVGE